MESPQPASIDIELKQYYTFSKENLPHFLKVLSDELHQQVQFISSIEEIFKVYEKHLEDDHKLIANTKTFYDALKQKIALRYLEKKHSDFDERFGVFNNEIETYISSLAHQKTRTQDNERFYPQPEDAWFLRLLKYYKRSFYGISQFPVKAGNLFRKLLRKPIAPPKVWHHQIPLKQLISFYLQDELASEMQELLYDTNRLLADSSQKLQKLTNIPDETILKLGIDQAAQEIRSKNLSHACSVLIEEIKSFEEGLSSRASQLFDQVFYRFQDAYHKVGTIELASKRFRDKNLEKKHAGLNRNHAIMSQRWSNTHFAIYERWRMDEERLGLKYLLLQSFYDTSDALQSRISEHILPHMVAIIDVLKKSENNIGQFSGEKTDLRALLVSERRTILKDLRHQKVPEAVESLVEQGLAGLLGQMEATIEAQIERLHGNTILSKSKEITKETKSSELQSFSLRELLSYATFPEFKQLLSQTKSAIVQDLDKVQKSLVDLSSISDFNLESALAMIGQEDKSIEEGAIVAREGLQRAATKCEDIAKEVADLKEKVSANLHLAVSNFNRQLDKLSDTDNIFDLQLQIAKAKALGRGRAYKGKALELLRTSVPYVRNYAYKTTKQATSYYQKIKDQYGLTKAPTLISAEISDYLAEVNSSIALLPFVYQRLFDIAPLKDRSFYEERVREMGILKKAHENWNKGHFAPVVVVGEKGAGATTLINFFTRDLTSHHKILRAPAYQAVPDPKALITGFSEILEVKDSGSVDELIADINNLPDRYMIVIENLQQFYLRRVGGFETLKSLLRIMSGTNHKIFWISSCHTYTWHYLDGTIDISDFFGYINFLEGLKDQQIVQAILKRHQMSGYNIHFEAPPEIRLSRKYRKLSEAEKQDYLEKQFFMSLNKFAKNNLSLALIYWLRSTKSVEGNVISFGFINPANFGFLESISTQKMTILHALLLHDLLSASELSVVLSKDTDDLNMLLLLLHDDGIIVRQRNRYMINPLLYRQTVNLLQSRNFI